MVGNVSAHAVISSCCSSLRNKLASRATCYIMNFFLVHCECRHPSTKRPDNCRDMQVACSTAVHSLRAEAKPAVTGLYHRHRIPLRAHISVHDDVSPTGFIGSSCLRNLQPVGAARSRRHPKKPSYKIGIGWAAAMVAKGCCRRRLHSDDRTLWQKHKAQTSGASVRLHWHESGCTGDPAPRPRRICQEVFGGHAGC